MQCFQCSCSYYAADDDDDTVNKAKRVYQECVCTRSSHRLVGWADVPLTCSVRPASASRESSPSAPRRCAQGIRRQSTLVWWPSGALCQEWRSCHPSESLLSAAASSAICPSHTYTQLNQRHSESSKPRRIAANPNPNPLPSPFNPKPYHKVIHYNKFEHPGIIRFWVMLRLLMWKCNHWPCDLDLSTQNPCHF